MKYLHEPRVPFLSSVRSWRNLGHLKGHLEHCPAYSPRALAERGADTGSEGLDLEPCMSCRHYPVYGLMMVSDLGRTGGIHRSDQLTMESIAYAVSAVLQNSALYNQVKSAERFREKILEGMTNGLITTDHRGHIVFANPEAQRMLGQEGCDLAGRDLAPMLEVPGGESPLRKALVGERTVLHLEGFTERKAPRSIPNWLATQVVLLVSCC